ncbi:hypothetical protein SAMN04488602_105153 [Paenibacillus sp. cl123]|nr:hypothetical protein SAMN04488602_105153 [Paenibacillus sp. cl123]
MERKRLDAESSEAGQTARLGANGIYPDDR